MWAPLGPQLVEGTHSNRPLSRATQAKNNPLVRLQRPLNGPLARQGAAWGPALGGLGWHEPRRLAIAWRGRAVA